MKSLITTSILIACLIALTVPVFAGDGGPLPVCPPGTQCMLIPGDTTSNRPLCCVMMPPPHADRLLGDINVKDRTLAQFPLAAPTSVSATSRGTRDSQRQESSAITRPNTETLSTR